MDRNTALGAAAGVTLAVVGAVSALFLTIDQPADAAEGETPVVEYVDQYGNPIGEPATVATDAGVVVMNADGTVAESAAYSEDEYPEEEYEEHGEEAEDDEDGEHGEEMEGEYDEPEHDDEGEDDEDDEDDEDEEDEESEEDEEDEEDD